MSTSVGQVHLDVGLNQSGLKKQITGLGKNNKRELQQAGKSLGSSLGQTFSVAFGNILANLAQQAIQSLGGFFTSSIELGSSIAELENVTNTVFPTMSAQIESFSKSAIQQYGLTEMQAKKMTGTFGAMAQAFGYTEQQSYNMSTALTGLVGDTASFYNLDHDVAYTKIKSVFTGETESLKELGIVMTQTALDEFALQQGMGKTTKEMNEQEKVALRMAFVTDKLSFAAGDFNKTQHQWANQTRILSGQWDSFKAAIGQGFIAVLTPVIQELNRLMAVVVKLGEKFRDFISTITGQKSSSGAGALIQEVSEATNAAADTAETASDTATSAAKKVQKSVMGFDKLNKLSDNSSSGSGSGSGGGSSIPEASVTPGAGGAEKSANSAIGALDSLKKKLEEITSWTGLDKFWEGIQAGIDKINFSGMKEDLVSIFNNLKPIATAAFDGFGEILRSKMSFFGTTIGETIALTGKSIELVLGGVRKFLNEQSGTISQWISETSNKIATGFNNLEFASEIIFGSLWGALDTNQETIENSISNVLTTFSNMGMTIGTIFSDLWVGVTQGIADFANENKPLLDEFFNGIIDTTTKMSNSVTTVIGGIFSSLDKWWEDDGKRIWGEIVEVFFDLVEWVMKIWNEVVKPIIDNVAGELDRLWTEHLKPLWDELLSFFTSVWDLIKVLWDKWLKPIVDWIIEYIGPIVTDVVNTIVRIVGTLFGYIVDVVKGIIKSLKGVIDFIVGVFTGDWKKAWNGIKSFFGGIWDAIWGSIKATINLIIEGINLLWSGLYGSLRQVINGVGSIVKKVGSLLGQDDWGFSIPKNAPMIPRLAEGGYVRANQPQLAMIGDNTRHGEIVAPEDKLYDIVSRALQAFMGQLIMALNSSNGGSQKANETMQLIIQLGEETIVNRIIKMVNAESRRQGKAVIKI